MSFANKNKRLTIAIIFMLIFSLFAVTCYSAGAYTSNMLSLGSEIGDVDGENGVRIKDAVILQKYIVKLVTLTDDQKKAGDVNGDGNINLKDVILIQQKLAHIIDKFPVENETTSSNTSITTSSSTSSGASSTESSTSSGGITSGGYIDGFY